ncbi:MAG: hypothetical protein H7A46_25085 [Verrucomicrobiales bacterium]|nr:hypothetical protein [Verrucomicrobiales bacterium]
MAGETSTTDPKLVRLLAAVIASAMSVVFVVAYSHVSRSRFEYQSEGAQLMHVNKLMCAHGGWLWLLPSVAVLAGLILTRRRPPSAASFEALLAIVWLVSLGLVGFCLVSWQLQDVPIFHLHEAAI